MITKPGGQTELRQALGMLLATPELSSSVRESQVDMFCRYVQRSGLSLEHCYVARSEGTLRASCLCLDMPGRVGLVMLPCGMSDPAMTGPVVRILRHLALEAAGRGVQFLQATLPGDARQDFEALAGAGFQRLAELVYLECEPEKALSFARRTPVLEFLPYDDARHAQFAEVVLATYEGSLDCGSLNGRRDIHDILASHRGVGRFDPGLWMLGCSGGQPVGVLLMAELPETGDLEVVYIGLKPAFRGMGFGAALMRQAARTAREQAAIRISVAVDSRNTPARRLYEAFGFAERFRRVVWILMLQEQGRPSAV